MIQRLIYILIAFTFLTGILTACSESDDLVGHDYYDNVPVRIRPMIKEGIEYEITTSRSTGPFEKWSDNPSHWLNADFYTYALETNNFMGGEANYQNVSEVMDHQLMRIQNVNGELKFLDNSGKPEEKYYSKWRARRFKFFTYYTDDAKLGECIRMKTKITQPVNINGHQDLMHGFAYHTDQELSLLISRMPNNDETKIFTNGNEGRDYLYSGMSGNRGIHPQFHLKHLLTRFNVEVRGIMGEKDKKYSFLQVLIDSVAIVAPSNGTITIANDLWNDEETYNKAFENREILTWDNEMKPYGLDIKTQKMTNSAYLPNVDFESLRQQVEAMGILSTKTYHQVNSMDSKSLCDPILLPSVDSTLVIVLGYRHIYYDQDEAGNWIVNQEKTRDSQWRQPYVLSLPKELRPYKPGATYTIQIKIYGPEQISIDVLNGEHWKPGGDVDIDTETDDRNINILQ